MINRLVTSRNIRSLANCSARCISRSGVASRQLPVLSAINNSITHQFPSSRRQFSDTHDDFASQKKDLSNDNVDTIHSMIDNHVKSNRVMLYMKGSPAAPQCGFSATVVGALKQHGADFSSVNILDYPEVREGIKKYSQWPTIPQLYVDGEFVGGCDIITSMDESGELKELLDGGEEKKE
mmetsp:Transcript_173/g.287  ORF Transcript_173/g.287 Transcript_173/m.287 type:complete len:180 (-) Transcript_173:346-885(-)|eukprot:CAMPEP_0201916098 /NCGR_PEP_ID=MMETSP0903-20130614/5816_1 /ASSEMBLY_ACC=CAM_ASM_000552 /TAXON_ID=420261 /ORGANISM="Thalassiosira antarctica, Strain CCMP982" /LENGTH=179 /DNA_ID=CAMNT_0048451835 /DNA_START=103 /DNA_END=642 /DNA_ORIENTATION=-